VLPVFNPKVRPEHGGPSLSPKAGTRFGPTNPAYFLSCSGWSATFSASIFSNSRASPS
jgi:hypothetical protein